MLDDPSTGTLILVALAVFVAVGLVLFLGYMIVGAMFEGLGHDFGSRTGLGITLLVAGSVLGTLILMVISPGGTAVLLGVSIGVALAMLSLVLG